MNAELSSSSAPSGEVLEEIARLLAEQQAAILTRDAASLTRLSDHLAQRLPPLDWLVKRNGLAPDGEGIPECTLRCRAVQLRDQLLLNQTLLHNGLAVIDHFVLTVVEESVGTPGDSSRLEVTA